MSAVVDNQLPAESDADSNPVDSDNNLPHIHHTVLVVLIIQSLLYVPGHTYLDHSHEHLI